MVRVWYTKHQLRIQFLTYEACKTMIQTDGLDKTKTHPELLQSWGHDNMIEHYLKDYFNRDISPGKKV